MSADTLNGLKIVTILIGFIILLVNVPICVYYGAKYFHHRRHTVLVKRYMNLSFHQMGFILFSEIGFAVYCFNAAWGWDKNKYFKCFFQSWFWFFFPIGFLWLSMTRYWHLWFDINYVTASLTHRWYEIIRPNIIVSNTNEGNYKIIKSPVSSPKTSTNTNINTNAPVLFSVTSDSNNNNNNNNNNSVAVGDIGKNNINISVKRSSSSYIYNSGTGVLRQRDVSWFLNHKSNLGNYKYTIIFSYCLIIIVSCILFGVTYITEIKKNVYQDSWGFTVAIIVGWSVYALTVFLPMVFLCFLYYQVRYRLKFEDNFFVGDELKYIFYCLTCSNIIGVLATLGYRITENYSPETKRHAQLSVVPIAIFGTSISYLTVFLVITKWVLKHIEALLNDPKFVTNFRGNGNYRMKRGSGACCNCIGGGIGQRKITYTNPDSFVKVRYS